ncbi:MAG: MmgE/PrpD family protein [Thermoleophilia bacterium]|nr:MmgE/PrpD family protein [Thermoleophilia bacterium]
MERSYAERYSDFATRLTYDAIPRPVVAHAKSLVLDSIGITLASTKKLFAEVFPDTVLAMGGTPESSVVGRTEMVPAPNAALANGTLAHFLDFDDSHLKSGTHNGATAVPTTLAVGEGLCVHGRDALTALVAGLEVMTRVGSTLLNFHDKGFHATGIVGPFGAAVIASKLMSLSSFQLTTAQGICGSQAAALMECRYDGTMVKRMHPGWSAHAGILAARLAEKGFTGPRTVYEGHFGLYRSHLGEGTFDPAEVDSLGQVWETLDCLIKPYPCSHYLHPYLDAAKSIRESEGFDSSQVESVELLVSKTGASLTCEAPSVQPPPETPYVAQFSLRYAVALMLHTGRARLEDFQEPTIRDPAITALGRRISHTVTDELSFAGKPYYSGWIKVRMKDGRMLEEFQEFNRGSRQNPMSREEVESKFLANAAPVVGRERAEAVLEAVTGLEDFEITDLAALLRF